MLNDLIVVYNVEIPVESKNASLRKMMYYDSQTDFKVEVSLITNFVGSMKPNISQILILLA